MQQCTQDGCESTDFEMSTTAYLTFKPDGNPLEAHGDLTGLSADGAVVCCVECGHEVEDTTSLAAAKFVALVRVHMRHNVPLPLLGAYQFEDGRVIDPVEIDEPWPSIPNRGARGVTSEEFKKPENAPDETSGPAFGLRLSYAGREVIYGYPSPARNENEAAKAFSDHILYSHSGRPYTLTPAQKRLPHGTVVSVAHGAIRAGEGTAWKGADAAFTAEVLYHCDTGLTVVKTIDPRHHTRRYRGYTETVETSRLDGYQEAQ
ncbi:hypothetical protein [Streptomyces chattanoogensis]|uniref:hypothetical protein n=1 Tax=Streptomyces chattanoogensis TaxID=66876 RepID=UPI0036C4F505